MHTPGFAGCFQSTPQHCSSASTHSQRDRRISRDGSYQHQVIYSSAKLISISQNSPRCFHRADRQVEWTCSVFFYINLEKKKIHCHTFRHPHLYTRCRGIDRSCVIIFFESFSHPWTSSQRCVSFPVFSSVFSLSSFSSYPVPGNVLAGGSLQHGVYQAAAWEQP